jgi:hypothetical protein
MTGGIEPILWTATALLCLAAAAYVVATLLPPFLFHEPGSTRSVADRSLVAGGRVFCRLQGSDVDLDECVGCPHLRVMDGRASFIVCDGRAAAAIAFDR